MSSAPATTFHEAYPLKDLRPADYNPRHLSDEACARLQEPIGRHGVVKPVILNADGTLVAGHQRTKAMTALGMTHTPAVMLGTKVRLTDEIQFNLLHNRVETEASVV
ncbi:ParB N-terminal domain-containing protein [Streptomyces sp. NBC_00055]|uniref:ParB N-terminal domain-containing protein n=1 Tax=Streptomyces sp. NBC_00055 TaxID=2975632 RepID=UPI0032468A7E